MKIIQELEEILCTLVYLKETASIYDLSKPKNSFVLIALQKACPLSGSKAQWENSWFNSIIC